MLLSHPEVDVNRRNNDRLTSFMLAMQAGGPLVGRAEAAWPGKMSGIRCNVHIPENFPPFLSFFEVGKKKQRMRRMTMCT